MQQKRCRLQKTFLFKLELLSDFSPSNIDVQAAASTLVLFCQCLLLTRFCSAHCGWHPEAALNGDMEALGNIT
jgi:hypothetical protein